MEEKKTKFNKHKTLKRQTSVQRATCGREHSKRKQTEIQTPIADNYSLESKEHRSVEKTSQQTIASYFGGTSAARN